jgi:HTH-type transcriptional regulator, quorum sensing regulator NprR
MTRSYISLIENGHAYPPTKTLEIISSRLGVSSDYFLGKEKEVSKNIADVILKGGWSKWDEEKYEDGIEMAKELLSITHEQSFRTEAYLLLISCYNKLKLYNKTLTIIEEAESLFNNTQDRHLKITFYLEYGAATFGLELFETAKKAYEKAIIFSSKLKRLQNSRIKALTYLGTTYLRLGNMVSAIENYLLAENEAALAGELEQQANVALGIGKVYFLDGNLEESRKWTTKSVNLLEQVDSDNKVLALHNLIVIEASKGYNEQTLKSLNECLDIYQSQNKPEKQASILQEIAKYWIYMRDLKKAKSSCKQGVKLLDIQDNGVIRGKLYRLMGIIMSLEGDNDQSYFFLRMSYDILYKIRAHKEADISFKMINNVENGEDINLDIPSTKELL